LAHVKLPNPLARRHLLEGGLDPAKAKALGEAFLAAGREVEAVDFLEIAEAHESLERLRERAIEAGDAFLTRAVSAALRDEPTAQTWIRCAEAAVKAGRERDAETSRRLATVGE